MILQILIALHVLIFCWAFYNILYFGIKPAKSISWIFVVLFLPFVGALIFLLTGINRRKLKFIQLKEIKKRKKRNRYPFVQEEYERSEKLESVKARKISRNIYQNTHKPLYFDNDISILNDAKKTFDILCEAMEKAEKFIHLQYYIIEEGEVFEKICGVLEKKVKKGIEVRILYDALGSFSLSSKVKKKLKKLGIEIHPIMPLSWGSFLFTINYRNHRKICVVDNKIAFLGGVNISDIYVSNETELAPWEDAHVKIKGPAVDGIHRVFLEDYFYATKEDLSEEEAYLSEPEKQGDSPVQIVASGPDSDQHVVMQQYISFIHLAEKSVCILTPYFIPTFSVLEALKMTAASGIEVSLLLPRKTDSKLASFGMFSYFETLMESGVHIYLRDDFAHSKVLFIDDEISSIGSTNFDCRSFEHNYEINAIFFDKEKAKELRREFEDIREKATKLDLEEFRKRSNWDKTCERLSRFLSPLL
jgi:cardiolipin synthase